MKTTTNTRISSFSSLAAEHEQLTRLFERHQRALFAKHVDRALSLLDVFEHRLHSHIDYEERRVLPVYADQCGETAGATLDIFQAEHRKLLYSVDKLKNLTQKLHASDDLTGSILALLDEETVFKGLFRHHAFREQDLLYPRLDERTTNEERQMWLSAD